MTELDIDGGFDVHEYREGLKLLGQSSDSMRLENRADYRCPACQQPFEELLVLERDRISFNSAPNGPICLARAPDRMLILTH